MKLKIIIFYSIFLVLAFEVKAFASDSFILSAPSKEVSVGESFSVVVYASSPSQAMNAVSGTLNISGGLSLTGVSKASSIIDFWTTEPRISGNQVRFEGVVLNPGYQGSNGKLFVVNLSARKEGTATLSFSEGALLANDGLGSNIIDGLASKTIKIVAGVKVDQIPSTRPIAVVPPSGKIIALPVITDYSSSINTKGIAYIKGRGEPNALTKIKFKDSSVKSLGEKFILALQSKRYNLDEVLIKNSPDGTFEYTSPSNLVAGAYSATPYLVDDQNQTEKPGFGANILVSDSLLVKRLVVLINILLLLIPIVGLAVLIYFIPWYSRLRMRLVKKRLHLEEEKINLSETIVQKEEHLVDSN